MTIDFRPEDYPPREYWAPSAERAMQQYLATLPKDDEPENETDPEEGDE